MRRLCRKRKIGKLKSWVQRGTMGYMRGRLLKNRGRLLKNRGRLLKNEEDCALFDNLLQNYVTRVTRSGSHLGIFMISLHNLITLGWILLFLFYMSFLPLRIHS